MIKLILIVFVFLVLGALFIVSNDRLALGKAENLAQFKQDYYFWLSHLFSNSKGVVGYVVQSEWLPSENRTLQP